MADFPWWAPIPWLIGLVALGIAYVNFRRTRYPSVSLRVGMDGYTQRCGESDYHAYLHVDVVSRGADVFDLEIRLEWSEVLWVRRHRTRWAPRFPMFIRHDMQFSAQKALPNPLKNGQALRFELSDHAMRTIAVNNPHWRLPSERWPGSVRIAAYYSGRRLLAARSSWFFRRALRF